MSSSLLSFTSNTSCLIYGTSDAPPLFWSKYYLLPLLISNCYTNITLSGHNCSGLTLSVLCFHPLGDHKGFLCLHVRAVQRKDEWRQEGEILKLQLNLKPCSIKFCFYQSAPVSSKRPWNMSSFKCRIITMHVLSKWLHELFKTSVEYSLAGSKDTLGFKILFR